MPKKVTANDFSDKIKEHFGEKLQVHGEYIDSKTRVAVKCTVCGHEWSPYAGSLYGGHGCKVCAAKLRGIHKRISNDTFVQKFEEEWNGVLTQLTPYTRRHDPMLIQCNVCGNQWNSTPHNLLHGEGCPNCAKEIHDTNDVANFLKNNGYTCIIVGEYINYNADLELICECGNHFFTSFASLRKTRGVCKSCRARMRRESQMFTQEKASEIVSDATNGQYALSGDYSGYSQVTLFTHLDCGIVFETRFDHLVEKDVRCPHCYGNKSKGELAIAQWLTTHCLEFEAQKRFNDCRGDCKALPFDFYIPKFRLAIEYQGEQHYKAISLFGGQEAFNLRVKYDAIKEHYCKSNNITLICIPYWEFDSLDHLLQNALLDLREVV